LGSCVTACIELAKYGITVNAVLPGNILTEGLIALGPEYERSMAASVPLKKLGTVDDVGYTALVPGIPGGILHNRTDELL